MKVFTKELKMQKNYTIILMLCLQHQFLQSMQLRQPPEQESRVLFPAIAIVDYQQGIPKKDSSLAIKYCTYRLLIKTYQKKIILLKSELIALKKRLESELVKNAIDEKQLKQMHAKAQSDAQKKGLESDCLILSLRNELSQQKRNFGLAQAQIKDLRARNNNIDAQHTQESEELRKLKLELGNFKVASAETLAHKHKLIVHHKGRNDALVKVHEENTKRWCDQLSLALKKNEELRAHIRACNEKVAKEAQKFSAMNSNCFQPYKNWGKYLVDLLPPHKEN